MSDALVAQCCVCITARVIKGTWDPTNLQTKCGDNEGPFPSNYNTLCAEQQRKGAFRVRSSTYRSIGSDKCGSQINFVYSFTLTRTSNALIQTSPLQTLPPFNVTHRIGIVPTCGYNFRGKKFVVPAPLWCVHACVLLITDFILSHSPYGPCGIPFIALFALSASQRVCL